MNLNYRRKDFIVSVFVVGAAVFSGWLLGYVQGQEAIIKTIESAAPITSTKTF